MTEKIGSTSDRLLDTIGTMGLLAQLISALAHRQVETIICGFYVDGEFHVISQGYVQEKGKIAAELSKRHPLKPMN